MDTEKLYEVMFKRKSVRKYDMGSLDEKILDGVRSFINDIEPLVPGIKTEMKIISQSDVKSLMSIKAPYYVVVFSESKDGYLTNVGFMLQQLDLYMSSNGLGACWQGMAKPIKDIVNKSELEFVIMLAFGKPAEELHRNDTSEFKRNSIDKIRNNDKLDKVLEAVRIAPSAVNSQPWYFNINENKLYVNCVKLNPLKAIMMERMNKIDIGIGLYHLYLASKHEGKRFKFTLNDSREESTPKGYYNIGAVEIS